VDEVINSPSNEINVVQISFGDLVGIDFPILLINHRPRKVDELSNLGNEDF
tara:strand:- start:78 stop:230 length:153 start_codon:yes stop_codon:yes gene_type:complete